jgi:excisionase family DNA binding protein
MGLFDLPNLLMNAELATQEAADLINVSRPFLVELLEAGTISFAKPGRHRQVKFQDLIAYENQVDSLQDLALDELVAIDQELGLGCK